MACTENLSMASIAADAMNKVQQTLLRDGCFLPHHRNQDPADLALQASVSVSSERRFSGLGVWDKVEDTNLRERVWTSGKGHMTELSKTPCQWFPLDGSTLDRIGAALYNPSPDPVKATVLLRKVDSIWSYEAGGQDPVFETEIDIPAGFDSMFVMDTVLSDLEAGCYRLEIHSESSEAHWRCSSNRAHGVTGGHIVGSGRFHWNRLHGEMAFQLEPAQAVFSGEQILSGITRPTGQTHMWLSDPSSSLPQWAQLSWQSPVTIRRIELNFPTQLVLETHWENPFYLAPHIPTRYQIQVREGTAWKTLHTESGNTAHRRQHNFDEPVSTDALRVLIEQTHLSPSAGITEIRCY
jgi:hypothetical protein